jgi:hypothetical protein
MSFTRLTLLV